MVVIAGSKLMFLVQITKHIIWAHRPHNQTCSWPMGGIFVAVFQLSPQEHECLEMY